MKDFNNIDEILDFAIAREQAAVDFYSILSKDVSNTEMKNIFIEFAKQEMGHKALLQKVKNEKSFDLPQAKIEDIKIADYVVQGEDNSKNLTYSDALILAMRREKAAYDLYKKLASIVDDPSFFELFENLASEELRHKNRFEIEYDNYLSKGN